MIRVLVIDADTSAADEVRRAFEARKYGVSWTRSGPEGERRLSGDGADVVVLGLELEDGNGLKLLAALHDACPSVPVIVVSVRPQVSARVSALDAGASDYLIKPFAAGELAARVGAQARMARERRPTRLSAAGIELDLLARTAHRDGIALRLSAKEFDLLAYLLPTPTKCSPTAESLPACGRSTSTCNPSG